VGGGGGGYTLIRYPSVPLTNFTVQKLPNNLQTRECERTRGFVTSLRYQQSSTRQRSYSVHRHRFAACLVLPHFISRRLQACIIFVPFFLQSCKSTEDLWGIFRCSIAASDFWLQAKLVQSTSPGGPGKFSRYSNSLWAGRSGDRMLVGARFSAPVQTGPGAHPASYTMGTGFF